MQVDNSAAARYWHEMMQLGKVKGSTDSPTGEKVTLRDSYQVAAGVNPWAGRESKPPFWVPPGSSARAYDV